ncbi:MAG: hypothetical protein J6S96_03470 [Muribaculaceae bacterium]|nr:hypothetical protein [Muribaculaceae bacterium]
MIFVCPKCGKKIELSVEALIASEYYTVCPQCLTRLQIVGDTAVEPIEVFEPKPARHVVDSLSTVKAPASTTASNPQPPAAKPSQTVHSMPALPPSASQPPQHRPTPYYQQPQVQPPFYPSGTQQPYYSTNNPEQYFQPVQQQQSKKNYSCTFTGCLVWGLILMGILFLLAHM